MAVRRNGAWPLGKARNGRGGAGTCGSLAPRAGGGGRGAGAGAGAGEVLPRPYSPPLASAVPVRGCGAGQNSAHPPPEAEP